MKKENRPSIDETKKIVYFDMDNVLVDFDRGLEECLSDWEREAYDEKRHGGKFNYDNVQGFFGRLVPTVGAKEAIDMLKASGQYDLYILTTAPWENPSAWSDKLVWIKKYFGDTFKKKLIISHHKDLCMGDYLIDDHPEKEFTSTFKGELLGFGPKNDYKTWQDIIDKLLPGQKLPSKLKTY